MVLISIFLGLLYFLSSSLAGYSIASVFLHIKDRYALIGASAIFGQAFFMVLSNALGYVLPLAVAFIITALIVVVFAGVGVWNIYNNGIPPDAAASYKVIWCLLALGIVAGFAGMRYLGLDPWLWTHFPLPATLLQGNFPVVEPMFPWQPAGYHYGPALLVAGFSSLTGASLTAGYALQPLFSALSILFFSAAIARLFVQSNRAIFLASVLAFAGAGLMWLNLFQLVSDLFQHFILGNTVATPFKELVPSFVSPLGNSQLYLLGHRTTGVGYALFYSLLYVLLTSWRKDQQLHIANILTIITLSLSLLLTLETGFLLIAPIAVLYLVYLFFADRAELSGQSWKKVSYVGLLALIPALIIGTFQGGVLSVSSNEHAFSLALDGLLYADAGEKIYRITDLVTWRDFGLPILFLPFTGFYAWKKRRTSSVPLFLFALAIIHFLLPFALHFDARPYDMNRFFYATITFNSLLIGAWISESFMKGKVQTIIGHVLLGALTLCAFLALTTRLIIPNFRFQAEPVFAQLFPTSEEELSLYDWVKKNTTIDDYFYLGSIPDSTKDMSEEEVQQRHRILFMSYTGRYSVGPLTWGTVEEEVKEHLRALEGYCSTDAFTALGLTYLANVTEERRQWFKEKCRSEDWEKVYEEDGVDVYVTRR